MAGFKVTPGELKQGETNLGKVAGEIEGLLTRAQGEVRRLAEGWEGAAQARFEEYMREWKRIADEQQKNLAEVGKALGIASENYAGAEEAAEKSFRGS